MEALVGTEALLAIIVHLFFIILTWWALTAIKWESIMKKGHVAQIRLFMVLLTITISSAVSSFFLDYLQYTKNITYLLK
ncbi:MULTISPECIES: DUF1146 family protein [Bacillaceae]|jgi:uncharacterized integral membrane protein (TIGR02327 family)|uniref:DUF1146 family protein n=2 Tax=Gottfriedia TaxID=2837503 RepID=A0ABY4JK35_9BACI|nr:MULTISPECIES: DUF1146 family protein [Bacillaceae]KQL39917.1 hypothetical protein AN960_08035 [Bacillus sp. FJAT-25509]ODG91960.1 hypothetical protein BED47_05630 [Gottfriedia luciferensis]PFH91926.1 hypothetical protein COI44_00740 [Bacillus sp. AFS088145]PGL70299.1 hypothetical protein CN925_12150 [Bacillus sp. AFS055030]PGZ94663.1 hypothetical protein COE53_02695 [Bacillus sp. AFS029533]